MFPTIPVMSPGQDTRPSEMNVDALDARWMFLASQLVAPGPNPYLLSNWFLPNPGKTLWAMLSSASAKSAGLRRNSTVDPSPRLAWQLRWAEASESFADPRMVPLEHDTSNPTPLPPLQHLTSPKNRNQSYLFLTCQIEPECSVLFITRSLPKHAWGKRL